MRRDEGFTLIELMIVVAVLGILAAIAYPNYTEYMDRARRAEAKTALMEGAQALERYYSVHGSYLDADGNLAQVFSAQAPATGTPNYTLAAEGVATATNFMLQATRVNRMANDPCGDFRVSHAGARTLAGATRTVTACW
ncbi:type IV pilin protein [Pseudomonas lalucatii]|uniref:Type IV pilin protein n=1 Tax=Pseudomonas lalucatii TaxID=1424203 RepID=A0ABS5Q6H7_9PSED|nr:type IV pilin protein [Pseudomonas lalucatii]MBS7663931.1 type IV pilin protein [Pseudomonas lalucatii]QVM86742.1 type IV pilin protein [Pseudomonas lalucatii]